MGQGNVGVSKRDGRVVAPLQIQNISGTRLYVGLGRNNRGFALQAGPESNPTNGQIKTLTTWNDAILEKLHGLEVDGLINFVTSPVASKRSSDSVIVYFENLKTNQGNCELRYTSSKIFAEIATADDVGNHLRRGDFIVITNSPDLNALPINTYYAISNLNRGGEGFKTFFRVESFAPVAAPVTLTDAPSSLVSGQSYKIVSHVVGDDFTSSGASDNNVDTVFTYDGNPPTWLNGSELGPGNVGFQKVKLLTPTDSGTQIRVYGDGPAQVVVDSNVIPPSFECTVRAVMDPLADPKPKVARSLENTPAFNLASRDIEIPLAAADGSGGGYVEIVRHPPSLGSPSNDFDVLSYVSDNPVVP
jgi:hypothetical protein